MTRMMGSVYMHWAKTREPVSYNLASSEVPGFRLDRFPIGIADLELDGASRYRYPPLRAAIATKCGVAPEQVVMADGASMANMLAMAALISPGDEVLVEYPVYEPLLAAAQHLGARITRFTRESPHFRIEPEAVERALTPATRLIVLTNLHNPTSARTDNDTLRAVGEMARHVGARVLIDEIFLDAAMPELETAALLGETFVTLGSLTKVYGLSGLRCGWILADPELAERIWLLNELFAVSQPHATERLSCLALERLDEVSAETPALLARNQALANEFFASRPELEVVPMTGGITAFPRLKHGDVDRLDDMLRGELDTSIVPGRFFGLADHFRVGVGGPTDIVIEGLSRLGTALDRLT